MFGLYLIVDRKMDFWEASMASIEKVKTDFFPYLGLSLVAAIIGEIGSLACGIGVFATAPIYFTILAVTYRDVFDEAAQQPAAPPKEIDTTETTASQQQPSPEAPDVSKEPESPEKPDTPDDPEEGKE